ncbi:MAG TPA: hypothetical protein VKV25_01245, partial [Acidimicrobiales bacterium]|nr:hypothetical protein [Acidimicrobiales bacterium]
HLARADRGPRAGWRHRLWELQLNGHGSTHDPTAAALLHEARRRLPPGWRAAVGEMVVARHRRVYLVVEPKHLHTDLRV